MELLALAVKQVAIRCRRLDDGGVVTLRPSPGVRHEVEGELLTVEPARAWTHRGHPYLAGRITAARLDMARALPALRLPPLGLQPAGWTAGPRQAHVMESVVPGADYGENIDPVADAAELTAAGDCEEAAALLHRCLEADPRCVDAYAHLGNLRFDEGKSELGVSRARKSYRAGVQVGELALGPRFRGALPWGIVDNRPFLRCLYGLGLSHWRLEGWEEAREMFGRLLRFEPDDKLGVRFLLPRVEAGMSYLEWASNGNP